ncbi:MAG: GYD domain-containing protein [Dehalococcoidia bacterium]|nr:GYD domain-containing protein [Dehalococcoidia bacterium]MSQ17201.1 GYD domain-containing protein [Dehalococcoidia bacterium]
MSLYFLLGTLTNEGQRMLHANPRLVIETVQEVRKRGATILGQYGVLGEYDFIMMAEADDNEAVAQLSLEIGVRAGLHMETLPAIPINILAEGEEIGRRGEPEFAEVGPGESEFPADWRLPDAPSEPSSRD